MSRFANRDEEGNTGRPRWVATGVAGWGAMTEIYDFWNALWHDAWIPWDGLWLFQIAQRPIDQALGVVASPERTTAGLTRSRREPGTLPKAVS